MGIEEETINPIINFLHKLLGSNLWILPISFAIGSWCLFFYQPDIWWLLYIAIICSLITILHIGSIVFVSVKNAIQNHKNKKVAQQIAQKKLSKKKFRQSDTSVNMRVLFGSMLLILKKTIEAACLFLQLEIHDEDIYFRYVKIPDNHYSEEGKLYQIYFYIIDKFTYRQRCGATIKLIEHEQVKDNMYFKINPYLYSLLEHFQSSREWGKV